MERAPKDKTKSVGLTAVILACTMLAGCATGWRAKLDGELPVLGHRNWIVVADSAYPAQSRTGIETVYTGAGQVEVVEAVLKAVDAGKHVRATVYLDAELEHVSESSAPGIDAYRKQLSELLGSRPVTSIPHEEVIAKLDEAAKMFNVLILKTDLAVPYTSVFLELDCGYWSAEAEKGLREAIERAK